MRIDFFPSPTSALATFGRIIAGVTTAVAALSLRSAEPRILDVHGTRWEATVVAEENFADPDWPQRWTLEGNAVVEVRDGALWVATSTDKSVERAATLWWHEPLPTDVLVEVTAEVVGPIEDNAANLNLFFHARENDGRAYQPGRSGRYADYHQIPNYIMTLTGGFQEGWARLRRNPEFTLLNEDPAERSEVGGSYRLRALFAGGRIRYWINDRLVHDVVDTQPLPGGHFALRTWRSNVRWSQVRFSALRRVEDTPQATYIETGFENASPLWHEQDAQGVIHVHLLCDHERASPNRATGHIHFLLHAQAGARLTLEFRNLENVWNGQTSPFARYLRTIR